MRREIIAILRGVRPDEVLEIGEALVAAGVSVIEVPLNSPDPLDSIARLVQGLGDRAEVGAGTVLTVEDVAAVAQAGGQIIVSPNCNPDVIRATKTAGLASYPGVMTPTEAFAAIEAGATGLKMFPGELIGIKGVKAMRAVLPPEMPVYAVGGVSAADFGAWIAAGATGFGIGSALYKPGDDAATVAAMARYLVRANDATLG